MAVPKQSPHLDLKHENFLKILDEDLDNALLYFFEKHFDDLKQNADSKMKAAKSDSEDAEPLPVGDELRQQRDLCSTVQDLFNEYNLKYFYGELRNVKITWSKGITRSAGMCNYGGESGICTIRFSMLLLKNRPCCDLAEILLHEMIHAYLFITLHIKKHDRHGPEFLEHMARINKEAGTAISVYHSFSDEVDHQRQYWWKCDGPCMNKLPFHGGVKKAMNKRPGRSDKWWAAHQALCGGNFKKFVLRNSHKQNASKRKHSSDIQVSTKRKAIFKETDEREKLEDTIKNELEDEEITDMEISLVEEQEKKDYEALLALQDVNLVANEDKFICSICFVEVQVRKGVTLHNCLHNFCRECLAGVIEHSDTPEVQCPFRSDEYMCECHLQDREIKSLVNAEVYERHLQRSVMVAENQAQDSFHCKTADCPGWILLGYNLNAFICPVCHNKNCITCAAIHCAGMTCYEYQTSLTITSGSSEAVKKSYAYLQNMLNVGNAMRCPRCQVIVVKEDGCDSLVCTVCHLEICWATRGPRWGPKGAGDISGGCRCKVNNKPCHPKCRNCH